MSSLSIRVLVLAMFLGACASGPARTEGGADATPVTTSMPPATPTTVTTTHVGPALQAWSGELVPALERAVPDEEPLGFPVDGLRTFEDVRALADRAGRPLATALVSSVQRLAAETTKLRVMLRVEDGFHEAVRRQRKAANDLGRELARLRDQYDGVSVPREIRVPPARITHRSEQMIIPIGEFPLSGYRVGDDLANGASGWRRTFQAADILGADYVVIAFDLDILRPSIDTRAYFDAEQRCAAGSNTKPVREEEVSAPASGDRSRACRYDFGSGWRYDYHALHRNAVIQVQLIGTRTVRDAVAIDQAVALVRKQIAIIDRVSPPDP